MINVSYLKAFQSEKRSPPERLDLAWRGAWGPTSRDMRGGGGRPRPSKTKGEGGRDSGVKTGDGDRLGA